MATTAASSGLSRPAARNGHDLPARGLRVTFLTHYFPPEVGAPQARIAALARGLAERGATVCVHTGVPHYPDGLIPAPYRNRPLQVEYDGAVRIVRSAVYAAPNAGFARRIGDHLAFASSALLTARASGPADVVVAETPPLFLAGAAIAYARAKRARLIVHVADLWPAAAVELGALRDPRAVRLAERLETACYRAADRVVVPTAGLADWLDRAPGAAGKVVRIPPSVDLARVVPPLVAPNGTSAPLRVLYAGTVGLAHGVEDLVTAVRSAPAGRLELTIAGKGAEIAAVEAAAAGAPNVRLAGLVPYADVPDLYAAADAAVVLLRDRELFRGALPTKMLEAFAFGRPVVLAAPDGEAAELVREGGCGIHVAPESPEALAAALERLRGDRALAARLGAAGRRLVEERYGRELAVSRWEQVLAESRVLR